MNLPLALTRRYATASPRPPRFPPPTPSLSLSRFLLRQRALSLYRAILRACRTIPPPTRAEMEHYARDEFERRRGVEDAGTIRYLLSTGKTEFERVGTQVRGMG